MRIAQILTAIAIAMTVAILPGCENKPADTIPRATTNAEAPAEPAEVEAPAEPAEAPTETPAAAPAEEAPAETPPPAETPAPAGEPLSFKIVPNDENILGFTGYKVTGKQQGGWTEYEGTVQFPDGTIESGIIDLTIQMESLFSGASMLTDTLKTESWFNVAAHPTATFKSTKIEKAGDAYNVSGDLTLRGVTKNITFPAQISIDGGTLTTQAEFALNRHDWGIKDEGFAGDLVEAEVVIQFQIVTEKEAV